MKTTADVARWVLICWCRRSIATIDWLPSIRHLLYSGVAPSDSRLTNAFHCRGEVSSPRGINSSQLNRLGIWCYQCFTLALIFDFLLVINSNWHPISYRFGVITALFKFWTHGVFEPPLGLRDNIRYSSWAHWKARSGLPVSVNWTFLARGVTADALRANIGWKSAISLQQGPVDPKFQVEGSPPPTIFLLRKLG